MNQRRNVPVYERCGQYCRIILNPRRPHNIQERLYTLVGSQRSNQSKNKDALFVEGDTFTFKDVLSHVALADTPGFILCFREVCMWILLSPGPR